MEIAVGDVYLLHTPILHGEPKKKFHILVCSTEPLRWVLINTKNAAVQLGQPDLGTTQVYLPRQQHPFLSYDSWADCLELRGFPDLAMLEACHEEAFIGRLTVEKLEAVLVALSLAPTVPARQRNRCAESIRQEIERLKGL